MFETTPFIFILVVNPLYCEMTRSHSLLVRFVKLVIFIFEISVFVSSQVVLS